MTRTRESISTSGSSPGADRGPDSLRHLAHLRQGRAAFYVAFESCLLPAHRRGARFRAAATQTHAAIQNAGQRHRVTGAVQHDGRRRQSVSLRQRSLVNNRYQLDAAEHDHSRLHTFRQYSLSV